MHVGFGLQLLTPAGPASQWPKSTTTSWSQVLFFFSFVPLDNKGREKKRKEKPQEKQQQQQKETKTKTKN